jgi:nucleotide-binding universal stress UspA family protein
MSAFARVVVGLDGSETAVNALRWAAERVPTASAIEVVHAGALDPIIPDDIEVHSLHSVDAPPARALMKAAEELNADAIVIGPHGNGFGHGLGSVAKRLLHEARLPVIVIDGREPPRSLGLTPPVVACVGYGDPADAASAWAADFAHERSLPLVLLHSVAYRPIFPIDSASDVLASYLGAGVSADWARDELNAMAVELKSTRPDLDVTTHVHSTSVIEAVRRAGETAEVVVLGKRSDEEFLHTIGTPRLRRLVARSRFPTAVVPTTSSD